MNTKVKERTKLCNDCYHDARNQKVYWCEKEEGHKGKCRANSSVSYEFITNKRKL